MKMVVMNPVRKYLLFLIVLNPIWYAVAQTSPMMKQIISRFAMQQKLCGQEKIYLHTDKAFYLAGENIWYKAYLVDAMKHTPSDKSNFVYNELMDFILWSNTSLSIC